MLALPIVDYLKREIFDKKIYVRIILLKNKLVNVVSALYTVYLII